MIRIGHAWDTHKLVEGRKLILGGIEVNYPLGLLGHSDADVVLHAVAESLLGSLALGDLGTFYPDNSDKTLNMDSKIILRECYKRVLDLGYHLNNLDLTIYSHNVRIAQIRESIQESIAKILNVDKNVVSFKATTWEKIGFVGEGLALACECVCLVEQ
jgi:2-C-methyl-D-erythritol 2,4-cyclodiphosphate synthase